MKIGWVTKNWNLYTPFAIKVQLEGHETLALNYKKKKYNSGDGLARSTDSLSEMVKWKPDALVFDTSGMGKFSDQLCRMGLPCYGSSSVADKLEFDRSDVLQLFEACGIKVPKSENFSNFKSAIAYAKKRNTALVIKIEGEAGAGNSMTYTAKESRDTVGMLEKYADDLKGKDAQIVLQDFVQGDMAEISTEGFFDGERFLPHWNHTLESKKLMNDDKGVATGCAGDVVWWSDKNKVIEKGILKLESALKRLSFYGQFDLNTIVCDDKSVYALEATPRMGINATLTLMSLLDQETSKMWAELGKRTLKNIKKKDGFAMSVTIGSPPYPEAKADSPSHGIPLYGPSNLFMLEMNPIDLILKDKEFFTGNHDGLCLIPTATGSTINECQRNVYKKIDQVIFPNATYRTDIGKDAEARYNKLKNWGMI